MKYLVVIDMQNDFVDGALGTPEAVAIVPHVVEKIEKYEGTVLFTRDTHGENYLETQEGRLLPVVHCVKGTEGWRLAPAVEAAGGPFDVPPFDKPTFGSVALAEYLKAEHVKEPIEEIEVCGLCTDICVVSNALLLKAFLPEVPITADASCCAGTTPENHLQALNTMKMCQILVRE